jgi:putative addiction module CopG family antidote
MRFRSVPRLRPVAVGLSSWNFDNDRLMHYSAAMKISLAPGLDKFIAKKIKTGNYLDAGEVIREGLRRWKEQEDTGLLESDGLEQEIQEGLESPDLPASKAFWSDLRKELHREHKNGSRRR